MANASVKINAVTSEFKREMKACAQSMKDVTTEYSLSSQKAKLLGGAQDQLKAKVQELSGKVDAQKEKIKAHNTYSDKMKTVLQQAKDKEKDLKEQIAATEAALQKSTEETGENSDETKALASELESLKEKLSNTESTIETTTKKLKENEKQTEYANRELANMETELGQVQQKLSTLKLKELGEGMQKAGEKISGAGEKLMGVTTAITGAATISVKTFADFEAQMSKVGAISGATGDDMKKLGAKAKEMGAKTKFSATESGQAMEYMAMAGWKTNDMLNGIEGIMNLAAASGEDLANTSDIVTDAMTAFGLSASGTTKIVKDGFTKEVANATHFADVLATASSNSNTNVAMLGESFKYAAPVAGALGYSVEDTAIALGLMANSGIKASAGGTALRTMLTNLAKPTDAVADAMDYLGISLQNGDGSMKSLMDVMTDLRGSFGQCKMPMDQFQASLADIEEKYASGELTEKKYNEAVADLTEKAYGAEGALKAKYAATLAGKEGMSGLLAIVSAAPEDFDKLTSAIYDSDGAAEKMATTMIDNLAGKATIMKSTLEGVSITIGEILAPKIETAVEVVTNLADKFLSLDEETQKNIVTIGGIVAAIAPTLIIFGKLTTHVGNNITSFVELAGKVQQAGGVFKYLAASPAVVVAAAIAAITAVIVTLWTTNEDFRNAVIEIWNGVKQAFQQFADGIKARMDELGITFEDITNAIKTVWTELCNLLAPIITGAFDAIRLVLETAFNLILGIWDTFKGILTQDWQGTWEGIKSTASTIWNAIKEAFEIVINAIKGVANVFLGWFGTSWDQLWNSVKNLFTTAWNAIMTYFSGVLSAIQTVASTTWNAIKTTVTTVMNAVKTTITTVWNVIKTTVTTVVNAIKTTVTTVWNAIKTAVTTVVNGIKTTVTTVWNGIKTIVTTVTNGVKTAVTTGFNAVKTGVTTAVNGAKTAATTAFNGIKSGITTAMNRAKTAATTAANGIKTGLSTAWNTAKTTTSRVFGDIKTAMGDKLQSAHDTVGKLIDRIKEKFNFSWSLPKLKMPHPSISGSFSLNPPSVPHFSIEWYKTGGIMTQPTVFGAAGNTLLAGGEAGAEAILPLTEFYNYITGLLDKKISQLGNQTVYVENYIYLDSDEIAGKTVVKVNGKLVSDRRKER